MASDIGWLRHEQRIIVIAIFNRQSLHSWSTAFCTLWRNGWACRRSCISFLELAFRSLMIFISTTITCSSDVHCRKRRAATGACRVAWWLLPVGTWTFSASWVRVDFSLLSSWGFRMFLIVLSLLRIFSSAHGKCPSIQCWHPSCRWVASLRPRSADKLKHSSEIWIRYLKEIFFGWN